MLNIAVDTGGTFTDFIWKDGEKWGIYKIPSDQTNPAKAVIQGIQQVAGNREFSLIHGSTVATNAILEKKGALTALITNSGFEDLIQIGRQNRPDLYKFIFRKNPPLVPPSLRFGLNCRINSQGEVEAELDNNEIENLIDVFNEAQIESIAVCLLFSFKNGAQENKIANLLSRLNIPISISHEILPEFREFERTSTTVINAYVSPLMSRYIRFVNEFVGANRFRIMQSNGGNISAETATRESVRTILSGPAAGAVGANQIGRMAGYQNLITFDMGGTSTDVSLIEGKLPLTMESSIAEYPVKVPMIDIHTVGAGGGSIATIDAGGTLKVGPVSAGADPGPICYGCGSQLTVTDANLFLGRLDPEFFLGGKMKLYPELLDEPIERMSHQLQLTPVEVAEGILAVANTTMERVIKVISVQKGYDLQDFTMFAFGGAGGLHAANLAKGLNMPRVLIPRNPGILSASGMLMSDVIKDYSRTVMLSDHQATMDVIYSLFSDMESQGLNDLEKQGVGAERIRLEYFLDMRYSGQSFEIMVPFNKTFRENFHQQHERLYGYCNRENQLEVVNIRLRAVGLSDKIELPIMPYVGAEPDPTAFIKEREVIFDGKGIATKFIQREKLQPGNRISGPSILVEYSSTTVVPPFAMAEVDRFGNILLSIQE